MKCYRVIIFYFDGIFEVAEKHAKIKPTRWLRWYTSDENVSHCCLEISVR